MAFSILEVSTLLMISTDELEEPIAGKESGSLPGFSRDVIKVFICDGILEVCFISLAILIIMMKWLA